MSVDISHAELAIVAACDDARSVGCAGQNSAGVDANATFAGIQKGFLTQHKDRRAAKKVYADDRRVHVDAPNAVGQ